MDTMFQKIDEYSKSKKSSQSTRQMKVRQVSDDPSVRSAPFEAPEWSLH